MTYLEQLREHICMLENSGLALREIARIAQLSPGLVCDIKKGRRKTVTVETFGRLMAVAPRVEGAPT